MFKDGEAGRTKNDLSTINSDILAHEQAIGEDDAVIMHLKN